MEDYLCYLRKIWLGMGLLLVMEIVVLLSFGRAALIPSILLGGCGSFIYSFMLAYRVKRATELAVKAAVPYMRAGLAFRLIFVGFVGIMAYKIPGIHIIPVLLGLCTLQISIYVYGFLTVIKSLVFKNH
jgi:hypothetical protein